MNSGDRNGLWRKLEEEKRIHNHTNQPLLKVWCAAHWSNLNYKDVSKSVKLELLWQMLSVWESYFHVSDARTHDLKEIAKTNGLGEPLHWPDYKEAWFAEFSHHLFAVFP